MTRYPECPCPFVHGRTPPRVPMLVAPPADERDAWRLIVDAIATEIVPPESLVDALRPVLARLAREAVRATPMYPDYADALLDAARTLEREDARRTWARTKILRRSSYMSRNSVSNFRRVILGEMIDAVRQFRGTDR